MKKKPTPCPMCRYARVREWERVDALRAELLKRNLWTAAVEAVYQEHIKPLKQVGV